MRVSMHNPIPLDNRTPCLILSIPANYYGDSCGLQGSGNIITPLIVGSDDLCYTGE
jgi:hypothetical protein